MLHSIYTRLLLVLETLGAILRTNASVDKRLRRIENKQDDILAALARIEAEVTPQLAESLGLTAGPVEEQPFTGEI